MKFGVLQFFSWPERRVPLETVYERALERIDVMDRTGYDAVWLAEHHFTTYSVCPSVHLMGMHVAGRTQNLRIGTAVSLAAFYHPLRLAEEVALLDVLSGGRVNWGAGRGFDPDRVRDVRRAAGGEHRALPGGGRDRAGGVERGADHLAERALAVRERGGAPEAGPGATPADGGSPRRRSPRSTGRRSVATRS